MARNPVSRGPLGRDRRGRFVTYEEELARIAAARPARPLPIDNLRPSEAAILAHPTDRYPRWRLRVFDLTWPWRSTRGSAVLDALASGNARRDREDRCVYLDACAVIQCDPPGRASFWPAELARQERMRQRRETGA